MNSFYFESNALDLLGYLTPLYSSTPTLIQLIGRSTRKEGEWETKACCRCPSGEENRLERAGLGSVAEVKDTDGDVISSVEASSERDCVESPSVFPNCNALDVV